MLLVVAVVGGIILLSGGDDDDDGTADGGIGGGMSTEEGGPETTDGGATEPAGGATEPADGVPAQDDGEASELGPPTPPPANQTADPRAAEGCFEGEMFSCDFMSTATHPETASYGATCGGRLTTEIHGECEARYGRMVD